MTLGIGVICEVGKYVIVASDTRASYGDPDAGGISPNDSIGKQWDFHPLRLHRHRSQVGVSVLLTTS